MAIDLPPRDKRPLVMHVVLRFDTGGLENGLVNLINHLPATTYRHAVVALTEVTEFRQRVLASDVEFIALHKGPGHSVRLYPRLFALMRRLRPAIVHTRNLAALEAAVPAWLAGVPVRLHGEHGRDVGDLDGRSRKHQWLRRLYRPFVTHYVPLSRDLASYLVERVGIAAHKVTQIYNGVDTARFRPQSPPAVIAGCPFTPAQHWLVGTVGRMQTVKNQVCLAQAFIRVLASNPTLRKRLRLVLIGEGPLRAQCLAVLAAAGVADLAWLPGERSDVAEIMRGLHCFALPSLAEGISNTILEAMATGLPVIATDVGGNADLVAHGKTGVLVPAADVAALAGALASLALAPERATSMGAVGRATVEARFSLSAMVAGYLNLYNEHLAHVRTQLQGV
jgi:sugar transferase (PEP-CTERM/EpsH1 system associated)